MDPKVKLDRHTKLWESGTKSARRAAVGGLVFAAVVLVNVLEPYADAEDDRLALTTLNVQQSENEQARQDVAAHLKQLREIEATIDAAPWELHTRTLIDRFAAGQVTDPPREANATLEQIAEEAEGEIVEPLEAIIAQDSPTGGLEGVPATMRQEIGRWLSDYRDTPWYRTVDSKFATVDELNARMESIHDNAMGAVTNLGYVLDNRTDELLRQSD